MATMFRRQSIHVFIFALTLGVFLAIGVSVWATSIGTNVSVGGTLTTTGNVTSNANSTFGDAATDVNLFTGTLQASTTALFTSGLTTYGNSTFGDAATDLNLFTGMLNATNTMAITGVANFYSNVQVNGFATTTGTNGNFSTDGTLGIASTSPSRALGVSGSALIQASSGTTTLVVNSVGSGVGSCIQLRSSDGTLFRVYAGATTTNTGFLRVESGSCQ